MALLKQSRDHNHALFVGDVILLLAYSCTKFDDFIGSAVPVIWLEPPKFCNGSHDLTTPLSGTVCRL